MEAGAKILVVFNNSYIRIELPGELFKCLSALGLYPNPIKSGCQMYN